MRKNSTKFDVVPENVFFSVNMLTLKDKSF